MAGGRHCGCRHVCVWILGEGGGGDSTYRVECGSVTGPHAAAHHRKTNHTFRRRNAEANCPAVTACRQQMHANQMDLVAIAAVTYEQLSCYILERRGHVEPAEVLAGRPRRSQLSVRWLLETGWCEKI